VRELTLARAGDMLVLAGLAGDAAAGRRLAERAIASGEALARFRAIVEAQGGDPRAIDDPALLPHAPSVAPVAAPRAGFVTAIDAYAVGELIVRMGGGRARKDDKIDPRVGFVLAKKVGDRVDAGEALAHVHAADPQQATDAARGLAAAYAIGEVAPAAAPLVWERVGA
jgi:thymidine phosphorylase